MDIGKFLKKTTTYVEDKSYVDFSKVMEKSYITVSFFGIRRVRAVGYTGSIDLESLCIRVSELVDSHPEFSEHERSIGLEIEKKIQKLYETSETRIDKANFVTRFFVNYFSSLLNPSHSDFFYFGVCMYTNFDYCTAMQFRKLTGEYPTSECAGYFREKDHRTSPDKLHIEEVEVWHISEAIRDIKSKERTYYDS